MSTSKFTSFKATVRAVQPDVALVLGSGMSDVCRGFEKKETIAFKKIPHLGAASVAGHRGQLSVGAWRKRRVLLFEGRLHFYEGHPWEKVVYPVRLAHEFGVRTLLMTNAAGGINPAFEPGSFMAIRDHIEWTRPYCWREPGYGGVGPDRDSPYSSALTARLTAAGQSIGADMHGGIYASLTGPCYETAAEIKALKVWGADAVGMSTAREIQTGYDLGLECAALACITNAAAGLSEGKLDHKEVLATARRQSDLLGRLIETFLT